jgi:transposase
MLTVPAGVRVFLVLGPTDVRKGFDGLAMLVQDLLQQNPFSGHLFVFRGRRSARVKILYYDQNGMCLFVKRLDQRKFT